MTDDSGSIDITTALVLGGGGVALAFLAGGTIHYCQTRPIEGSHPDGLPTQLPYEEGVELVKTTPTEDDKDEDMCVTVPSLPVRSGKKHFLDKTEAKKRALYLFPGLLKPEHFLTDPRLSVERIVLDILNKKVGKLRQDEENFERLLQLENAVELCLALGLNETVVRKRYEVIGNLKRELKIASKTPTLVTIRHLIKGIGVHNLFGDLEDMDRGIKECYQGNKWLSYLGVTVTRGNAAEAFQSVVNELKREHPNYTDYYMHGTKGSGLVSIDNMKGILKASKSDYGPEGERHDFGDGFYCFKGELQRPLSFAIDRCWPEYNIEDGSMQQHNPAIILFPKVRQFKKEDRDKYFYNVNEADTPWYRNESHLKRHVLNRNEEDYQNFVDAKKKWKPSNKAQLLWKEFVKLARYYGRVPPEKKVIIGWLHDCQKTELTDKCQEPKIDEDNWMQYCFRDPYDHFNDQLFIEFNVNWDEWGSWPENIKNMDAEFAAVKL